MRPFQFLAVFLVSVTLGACARDVYQAMPGHNSSSMAVALRGCKETALKAYFDGKDYRASILGGVVLGPLGSALMDNGKMSADDINPMVEKCMSDNGFVGQSRG